MKNQAIPKTRARDPVRRGADRHVGRPGQCHDICQGRLALFLAYLRSLLPEAKGERG